MADDQYELMIEIANKLAEITKSCDEEVLEKAVSHLDLTSVEEKVRSLHEALSEITKEMRDERRKLADQSESLSGKLDDLRAEVIRTKKEAGTVRDEINKASDRMDSDLAGKAAATALMPVVTEPISALERHMEERFETLIAGVQHNRSQLSDLADRATTFKEAAEEAVDAFDGQLKAHQERLTSLDRQGEEELAGLQRQQAEVASVRDAIATLDARLGKITVLTVAVIVITAVCAVFSVLSAI